MDKHLLVVSLAWLGSLSAAAEEKPTAPFDVTRIEGLAGAKAAFDAKEGVFKLSMPRDDLSVAVAGVKLTPAMGLTSWAAFKKVGAHTVLMGDTVLTEDQVNPVMSVALDNGLEVTALHNHFFWDVPKVMFMHIGGMGEGEKLATAVGKVWGKIKETSGGKGEVPRGEVSAAAAGTLDAKKLEAILGAKGQVTGGVLKFVFGAETRMHGEVMGSAMGVNTWAIHQHMVGENPRVMFLHFWGVGPAVGLAKGLQAARDKTGALQRTDQP
jgi:Domain of Unknown Function (DUF1259)